MNPPWILTWLNWCFLWYWPSLFVCIGLSLAYKAYDESKYIFPSALIGGWHDVYLVVFVGFCAWVVLCAIRNGYAVG